MTKHRVSDRIWRTVVFSGAMLGAPLVSADPPKDKPAEKQAKPKPPADTVASVQRQLDAVARKIDGAVKAVESAQNEADRKAAKARLEAARKDKAEIEKRLAALKANAVPETPIGKLEKQKAELDTKIAAAADAVSVSQNDADRQAARARLASLQRDKAEVEKNLAAEKAKLTKRPRADESDKPLGRGFILS